MRLIQGFLHLFGVLLGVSLILNAPVIVLVLLARRRMDPLFARALLAVGFAAGTAYFIWRMEWFDVFRHGVPSTGYFLQAFVPYTAAVGAAGWFLGTVITRRPAR